VAALERAVAGLAGHTRTHAIDAIDGAPGWRVVRAREGRGRAAEWRTTLHAPNGDTLDSLDAVRAYAADAMDVEESEGGNSEAVRDRAALQIQHQYRLRYLRLAHTAVVDAKNTMETLQDRVEHLKIFHQRMERGRDARRARLDAAGYAMMTSSVRRMHMDGIDAPEFVKHPVPFVSTLTEETGVTRETLVESATAILERHAPDTFEVPFAKAVLRTTHAPLLVGCLPLPRPSEESVVILDDGSRLIFSHTPEISPRHMACLATEFREPFPSHLQEIVRQRPVHVYDLFAKRADASSYLGSVCLERFLVRSRGRIMPAVSVESIVTKEAARGHGTRIFEFVRQVLFFNCVSAIESGIVFAQCLEQPFWNSLLDVTADARCLVFQMQFLYASYDFEEACIARSRVVYRDETTHSPCKQVA
jgi:hypothetical protein